MGCWFWISRWFRRSRTNINLRNMASHFFHEASFTHHGRHHQRSVGGHIPMTFINVCIYARLDKVGISGCISSRVNVNACESSLQDLVVRSNVMRSLQRSNLLRFWVTSPSSTCSSNSLWRPSSSSSSSWAPVIGHSRTSGFGSRPSIHPLVLFHIVLSMAFASLEFFRIS